MSPTVKNPLFFSPFSKGFSGFCWFLSGQAEFDRLYGQVFPASYLPSFPGKAGLLKTVNRAVREPTPMHAAFLFFYAFFRLEQPPQTNTLPLPLPLPLPLLLHFALRILRSRHTVVVHTSSEAHRHLSGGMHIVYLCVSLSLSSVVVYNSLPCAAPFGFYRY